VESGQTLTRVRSTGSGPEPAFARLTRLFHDSLRHTVTGPTILKNVASGPKNAIRAIHVLKNRLYRYAQPLLPKAERLDDIRLQPDIVENVHDYGSLQDGVHTKMSRSIQQNIQGYIRLPWPTSSQHGIQQSSCYFSQHDI
jgi:hypothetical protein